MPKKLKYELKPINLGEERIGQRLARFRKEKGLTQSSLGELIGITQSLVSDYENGRTRLSDDMIIRFAIALQKTADQILGLNSETLNFTPKLKFIKRMKELENLPEHKQKKILKSFDLMVKAALDESSEER